MSGEQFDEEYFLRGKQTGKSLYEDYRWMPDLTIPMVQRIIEHLGINQGETILDFGCARGYMVKAFRSLGHSAYGYDISEWAIDNCDPEVAGYVNCIKDGIFCRKYDWIIAKDVLEHIAYVSSTIQNLTEYAKKGIFAIVPLSAHDGRPYVIGPYEEDITHIQRMTLPTWSELFLRHGWAVTSQYRLPGVKDNWYKIQWVKGNGFITAQRIKE